MWPMEYDWIAFYVICIKAYIVYNRKAVPANLLNSAFNFHLQFPMLYNSCLTIYKTKTETSFLELLVSIILLYAIRIETQ
jgi:hypothetical protein